MRCFYCKGRVKAGKTVYAIQYGENVIVVKNVPCEECEECGEVEFTSEVMEKLEKIVNMAKRLMQEVAVIDYHIAA